jgi:serine/threonine protein kinase
MRVAVTVCCTFVGQELVHRHILSLWEVWYTEQDDTIYMVLEYCPGGEVATWDRRRQRFHAPLFADRTLLTSPGVPAQLLASRSLGGLPQVAAKQVIRQVAFALDHGTR